MQTNLGTFQSNDGRIFMAYWEAESGRVYMKMERTAFLSSFIEVGNAKTVDEACALVRERLARTTPSWR